MEVQLEGYNMWIEDPHIKKGCTLVPSLIPRPTSGRHFILAGKMGLVHIQRNLGSTAKFIAQFHVITMLNSLA